MDKEHLRQCLFDAGCRDEIAECILREFESGNLNEALKLMKKERCRAMDEYHESGRKVDCMDFVLRNLNSEISKNSGGI
jgi:hypothetical protein